MGLTARTTLVALTALLASVSARAQSAADGVATATVSTTGTALTAAELNAEVDAVEAVVRRFEQIAEDYRTQIELLVERRYRERRERVTDGYEGTVRQLEVEERERREEAITRFQRFLKRYPDEPHYSADALFRLAELLYERTNDRYLLAVKEYDEQLRRFEQGELAEEPRLPDKDYREPIAIYRRLIDDFPGYRYVDTVYYLLGYCQGEQGDLEEAVATYQSLVQGFPDSIRVPEAWMRIGEYYFDAYDVPDALELAAAAYQHVLDYPDSIHYDLALYKLGWTYYRIDRFDEAVDRFIELVDYSRKAEDAGGSGSEMRSEALQYIAISFGEGDWGGIDKARAYFAAIGGRPYEAEIWRRMGQVFFDQTRYRDAIEAFTIAVGKDGLAEENPSIQLRIVQAYERMRDMDGAVEARHALIRDYTPGTPWWQEHGGNEELIQQVEEDTKKALIAAAVFHHNQAQAFKRAMGEEGATPEPGALVERTHREYVRAAEAYEEYLRRYPHDEDAYDLTFYLAESYYYSLNFPQAAAAYRTVRDSAAGTAHREAAAFSTILSLEKAIAQQVAAGELGEKPVVRSAELAEGDTVEAQEIPAIRQELVAAYDAYREIFPTGDRTPGVTYKAAEIFYVYDHLDEARRRFEEIIRTYPTAPVAEYAANLIIESYRVAKDWEQVAAWSEKLLALRVGGDQEQGQRLRAELQKFKVFGLFRKAEELDAAGEYEKAAEEYVRLVDQNPGNEYADKALYNAAVAFEQVRRFESATRTYERVVEEYPQSPLAHQALFRVGVNAERFFEFDKAIAAYQRLVEQYPDSAHREAALYNAAGTLENTQQYRAAAQAYERYATLFPGRKEAPELFYRSGLVYEKMEAWQPAIEAFERFIGRYRRVPAQAERVVQAHVAIADAYRKLTDERQAQRYYEAAVREFRASGLGYQSRAADAAAKATFNLAEMQFERYDALTITGTGDEQAKALVEKARLQQEVERAYKGVLAFKRIHWSLAASYRIGHAYERFAEALFAAPIPDEIADNPEYADEYRFMLEDRAYAIEEKAVAAYRRAYEEARKARVVNEWTRRTLEGLNKYRSDEFPLQQTPLGALHQGAIVAHPLDDAGVADIPATRTATSTEEPATGTLRLGKPAGK